MGYQPRKEATLEIEQSSTRFYKQPSACYLLAQKPLKVCAEECPKIEVRKNLPMLFIVYIRGL
jgi:hypothetical protein